MSQGRWFRMYDEVLDDPKVQRLSPALFRVWVNVLCAASRRGGAIPPVDELAFMLRCDEDKLGEQLDDLASAGLIDDHDGEASPHNWSGRQFQSDTSTERVKRFRNRPRNVSETPTETPPDTDTDTDSSEAKASAAPSAASDTLDPKTILFRRGLDALAGLTDRKPDTLRATLGRWMKLTGDDAGAVLAEIERCRGSPVADPIAWIEARLKPRNPNDKPRRITSAEQAAASMGRVLARLDGQRERAPDIAGEHFGDAGSGDGTNGLPRRTETATFHKA